MFTKSSSKDLWTTLTTLKNRKKTDSTLLLKDAKNCPILWKKVKAAQAGETMAEVETILVALVAMEVEVVVVEAATEVAAATDMVAAEVVEEDTEAVTTIVEVQVEEVTKVVEEAAIKKKKLIVTVDGEIREDNRLGEQDQVLQEVMITLTKKIQKEIDLEAAVEVTVNNNQTAEPALIQLLNRIQTKMILQALEE